VVHKDVDRLRLVRDALENSVDLRIVAMIAADGRNWHVEWCVIGYRSTGNEYARALPGKLSGDAAPYPLCCSGHDGDSTRQIHVSETIPTALYPSIPFKF